MARSRGRAHRSARWTMCPRRKPSSPAKCSSHLGTTAFSRAASPSAWFKWPTPLMAYSNDRILLSNQRESQISRFRAWVMLLVPLAAILFQVYVPLFFQFLGFLEMPLLVVVYFALMRRSPISGLAVGALVGL